MCGDCCLTSICACVTPPPSLLTSLSICPCCCLSSTHLCLSSPLCLSPLLWGASHWLRTVCLLPADWLTEAPTAWAMPPWQHHSGPCVSAFRHVWGVFSSELADSISSLSSRYAFDISYCFHWNRTSLLLLFKTNALVSVSLWGVRCSLWNGMGSEPKWAEVTGKIWEK